MEFECEYKPGAVAYIGKNNKIYVNIVDVVGRHLILEVDGYFYKCMYEYRAKFDTTTKSLTDESYIRYINDNYLDTNIFEAIEVRYYMKRRTFLYLNKLNGISRVCTNISKLINGNGLNEIHNKNSYL